MTKNLFNNYKLVLHSMTSLTQPRASFNLELCNIWQLILNDTTRDEMSYWVPFFYYQKIKMGDFIVFESSVSIIVPNLSIVPKTLPLVP
ncbi:hypothetical protein KUTeg_000148 [Tegillarca granosa]|uniref:Uncharacterized protein n=1 Tax=Tegillarca granosa TaxID=220873 RepID=A0ABQ9FXW4_TEGGR|nr:hypothetical protein KUTeg_000148 [Tegillarca granosa]